MGVGLSGMISGLDTDSIVKAMVSGQQAKATKVENKITLNKWTKEAWSGLNTKIYSFYTKYASKLRLQTSYMTRTASSSNESVVKATAVSSAALGTHSLKVKSLASSQYVTGGQLQVDGKKANYDKNSKLYENLKVEKGTIIAITGKDNKTVKLDVTENTTIDNFLTACKDAGLTASFDTTQQRFFISSSESGEKNAFSITARVLSDDEQKAFEEIEKLMQPLDLDSDEKTKYEDAMSTLRQNVEIIGKVTATGYVATDKTEQAVIDAMNTIKELAVDNYAQKTAEETERNNIKQLIENTITNTATELEYAGEKYDYATLEKDAKASLISDWENTSAEVAKKDIENEVKELGITLDSTFNFDKLKEAVINKKNIENSLTSPQEFEDIEDVQNALDDGIISSEQAEVLKNSFEILEKWDSVTDTGGNIVDLGSLYEKTYNITYTTEEITDRAEYEDAVKQKMTDLLVTKVAETETYKTNVQNAKKTILESEDSIIDESSNKKISDLKAEIQNTLETASVGASTTNNSQDVSNPLQNMGLGVIDKPTEDQLSDGDETKMAVIAASDATIELDGATMKQTSNNFTVNGITLNLTNETEGDEFVQITVGKDVDSTYKLVKEAITEYNKLLEEMNTLYNADSARGYEPLTDEQKEAMTETDIENWEKKIKDSLLRRDDTLGTLLTSMRNALSSSYTDEDGKTYALSTFGIVTGNYTEKGKLHIYGDEEDATYATYSDRLKSALEEDPDKVMDVLTHVFGNLYETMTEKCAKTEISSALTFYNDKQYNNLLKDYEDDLDILEDRIKELEDRYYKQFTAMEKALSTLQNQSNSLASLLGTGQ